MKWACVENVSWLKIELRFTQNLNFYILGLGAVLGSSPSRGVVVPYNNANTSLNREDNVTFNQRVRRQSANYDMSPTGVPVCQSPHNMEGPISFVAPELAEETLMEVSDIGKWCDQLKFIAKLIIVMHVFC